MELITGSPDYEPVPMARYRDIRPAAVVPCRTEDDVVAALRYARESDLPVVPRGGGHCFAGRSSTTGVVVDLSPLDTILVEGDLATVGAGVRLGRLYAELARHDRTIPAGCGPTVGVAGLTLGGGIGLLGRRYGLTCDRLRSAQVVLADGRVVTCSAEEEPDLFWALRGAGGGQFGIVTSLVFETVPGLVATGFSLSFGFADAAALVSAWQRFAPDAPDELTAVLRITTDRCVVEGAWLGVDPPDLVSWAGVEPGAVSTNPMPYHELKRSLAQSGPEPVTAVSRTHFFSSSLPSAAVDGLVGMLEDGCELAFTPMGGAYNRVAADATSFAHRGERFLLEHVAPDESHDLWMNRSWETAHPYSSGRVYTNFPDRLLPDWAAAYHGDNYERLVRIKQTYDPDRVLDFPQSV